MKLQHYIPFVLFILFIVAVGFIYSQQANRAETIESERVCSSNEDCLGGDICYNPPDCGLGPDGAIPCPLRDDFCHKTCETNSDCPANAPKCLDAPWSDYESYKICFK